MSVPQPAASVTGSRVATVEIVTWQGRSTEVVVSRRLGEARPSVSPSLSVVILNWNGGDHVVRCLRSVAASPGVECIVVDNDSKDDSLQRVMAIDLADVVVTCPENLGYARGMNIGYAQAQAGWVVVLNCDAVVDQAFFDALRESAAAMPNAAILGGPSYLIDASSAGPLGDARGILDAGPMSLTKSMRVSDLGDEHSAREVLKVTGSCQAIVKPLPDGLAGSTEGLPFDESFVTYGEDIDLACRSWRAGCTTWYSPAMASGHVRSFGSDRRAWAKRGALRRNLLTARYRNILRHSNGLQRAAGLFIAAVEDTGLIAICVARRDLRILPDVGASVVRALRWPDPPGRTPAVRPLPRLAVVPRRKRWK